MTPCTPELSLQSSLAELATLYAGASRVFLRHGLDFCCHGQQSISQACAKKGLNADAVLVELRAELEPRPQQDRWDEQPLHDLIDHILQRFHEGHRAELPRLLQMANRVEAVHGEKADCPRGLAAHLGKVAEALELHMQKEEQILFPMLRGGRVSMANGPMLVMEEEHIEHGINLEKLRALAHNYVPPPMACGTWRALYLGLAELESEVMQHIHLENHVLFPRCRPGC